MGKLDMYGSFDFRADIINNKVTETKPGNYALGYLDDSNSFIVQYVGRADDDVRSRLLSHIGENYSKFKYSYASSPKDAFEKECKNFHDFGGEKSLHNKIHPDRPNDSKKWKCPYCNIYD